MGDVWHYKLVPCALNNTSDGLGRGSEGGVRARHVTMHKYEDHRNENQEWHESDKPHPSCPQRRPRGLIRLAADTIVTSSGAHGGQRSSLGTGCVMDDDVESCARDDANVEVVLNLVLAREKDRNGPAIWGFGFRGSGR